MSVKKTPKPQSIRYMLSADRKLQKLSLKRLSERAKRAGDAARSSRAKKPAAARPAPAEEAARTPPLWGSGARSIVLGVIAVVAAAALMASGDPSAPPADAPVSQSPAKAATMTPTPPSAVKATVKAPAEQKVKARTLTETAATPVKVEVPVKPSAPEVATVTITGCLQRDGGTFWLKDASGADAPKSRSWKSGFLKRNSSRVDVVGAAESLKLSGYVGQRIAATGVLANRALRTHSVRRVAASCN